MFQASRPGTLARPILPRLAPALLALAATALAGLPRLPFAGVAGWLESPGLLPGVGVALAGAAGLLACHLALLSVAPRRAALADALPAAMVAGALPGLGAGALLVPMALALHALLRQPSRRGPALVGVFGVTVALAAAGLHSPALHLAGCFGMLAAAALQIRRTAQPAGNDNRRAEPLAVFWSLPDAPCHATQPPRTSSPELGE